MKLRALSAFCTTMLLISTLILPLEGAETEKNPASSPEFEVKETSYGKPCSAPYGLVFSPDFSRVAYLKNSTVVIDGVEGKPYPLTKYWEINAVFSPDSKRVAYTVNIDGKWTVVVDGVEAGKYDQIYPQYCHDPMLKFSPDSKRYAFPAKRKGKWFVVVGDEKGLSEGAEHSFVSDIVFSPDSKRMAYTAWTGEPPAKQVAVIDGKEGKKYDGVGSLTFGPDSKRMAYVAYRDKKCVVVVDDGKDSKEGVEYDGVGIPDYESDSFGTARWPQPSIIDKGDPGMTGGDMFFYYGTCWNEWPIFFSPDSKRLAYVAHTDGRHVAVVDGKEGSQYKRIYTLAFTPDSMRTVYTAGCVGGGYVVVTDAKESAKYEGLDVNTLAVSPDSQRIAYAAFRKGKWAIVHNDKELGVYDEIAKDKIVFSPDSKRMAYTARRENKWTVVLDGAESKAYARAASESWIYVTGCEQGVIHTVSFNVNKFSFGPDSKRYAYYSGDTTNHVTVIDGAEREDLKNKTVIFGPDSRILSFGDGSLEFDGRKILEYDSMASLPVFDSSDKFHILIYRKEELFLARASVKKP